MMPSLPYAIALFVALLCAIAGGRRTFAAGMVITAGWVLFNAAWWDNSPAALSGIDPIDIWCLTTLLIGGTILWIARDAWWSIALWGILTLQMVLHVLYQYSGLAWKPYNTALDALFLALLSVLMMAGGGKIVDMVSILARTVWHHLNPLSPASAKSQKQTG